MVAPLLALGVVIGGAVIVMPNATDDSIAPVTWDDGDLSNILSDIGSGDSSPIDYSSGVDMSTANLAAFLATIRLAESGGQYNALYGGGTFSDYSKFPQWAGKTTAAGPTHAAGAYQFEPATWAQAQAATGVPDFSPASQDTCAVWLIKYKNALSLVQVGNVNAACQNLASTWASIGAKGAAWYIAQYQSNGGSVTA